MDDTKKTDGTHNNDEPMGMDWLNACPVGERRELRVGEVVYVIDRRPAPLTVAPYQPPAVHPVPMPEGPQPVPTPWPDGACIITYDR